VNVLFSSRSIIRGGTIRSKEVLREVVKKLYFIHDIPLTEFRRSLSWRLIVRLASLERHDYLLIQQTELVQISIMIYVT